MEGRRTRSGLSRREFVRLVSLSGTALLTGQVLSACAQAPSAEPAPGPQPTEVPSTTSTATPSELPQASATWTPTPPEPEPYLPVFAQAGDALALPPPRTEIGIPLMRALSQRASSRSFRGGELPLPVISDLLWAAFGVNRPASGGRTAPSAYGVQDIDVYLATAKGLFFYDATGHRLLPALPDDLRAATGSQGFAATAPLDLVYVSDADRLAAGGIAAGEDRSMYAWAHSGFIAQNVYLYCASEGLATVVRSTIDREGLAGRMSLAGSQRVTLAQTVGYPA